MDPVAAKYIGAGLACLGMAGAGIGLGNLFGQFLSGALRNPSAAAGQSAGADSTLSRTVSRIRSSCCRTSEGKSVVMSVTR